MRIRIRFSKTGPIRYVGHLDFMRTFQKAVKKSGLAAVYSAGFNPHMLISFAAPLGVGEETSGDYADVDFAYRDPAELSEHEIYRLKDMGFDNDALPLPPSAEEMAEILSASMPPSVSVDRVVRVGLTKDSKAMSLVRFASWEVYLAAESLSGLSFGELSDASRDFMAKDAIVVHKKTKKSEKDVDIRPLIKDLSVRQAAEEESSAAVIHLTCASGSTDNLKPAVILDALSGQLGLSVSLKEGCLLRRTELYDGDLVSLADLGTPF